MDKLDYKKRQKNLYVQRKGTMKIVDVPEMKMLCIDGKGNPNDSQVFSQAVEALYAMSYTLKFQMKAKGFDYVVSPLEGLWFADDARVFKAEKKDEWKWTLMIRQPDQTTEEAIEAVREAVRKKKNPPALDQVRFESFNEGKAAQVFYVGPYSEEGETIQALHDFIKEEGYVLRGKHHEIYLNDMRKTAPEKLKTMIRQPVE